MKNDLISHKTFLQPFFEDFDKFFRDSLFPIELKEPKCDIETIKYSTRFLKDEKGEFLLTEVLVPGYSKDELKILITANRILQVEGHRKDDNKKFKLTKSISELCDLNSVKAECKDGVLKITMRLIEVKDIPID